MQIFSHQIIHSKGTHHKYEKALHPHNSKLTTFRHKFKAIQPLKTATVKMEVISQELPATSEPPGIIFGKTIASIEKVLKTTKSLNNKEHLL